MSCNHEISTATSGVKKCNLPATVCCTGHSSYTSCGFRYCDGHATDRDGAGQVQCLNCRNTDKRSDSFFYGFIIWAFGVYYGYAICRKK